MANGSLQESDLPPIRQYQLGVQFFNMLLQLYMLHKVAHYNKLNIHKFANHSNLKPSVAFTTNVFSFFFGKITVIIALVSKSDNKQTPSQKLATNTPSM